MTLGSIDGLLQLALMIILRVGYSISRSSAKYSFKQAGRIIVEWAVVDPGLEFGRIRVVGGVQTPQRVYCNCQFINLLSEILAQSRMRMILINGQYQSIQSSCFFIRISFSNSVTYNCNIAIKLYCKLPYIQVRDTQDLKLKLVELMYKFVELGDSGWWPGSFKD